MRSIALLAELDMANPPDKGGTNSIAEIYYPPVAAGRWWRAD
jgi:hypothetical protein